MLHIVEVLGYNQKMRVYQTKVQHLSGSSYREISKQARLLMHQIEKRTRRKPYIRSAYFDKEKIFLDYFWPHLDQNSKRERLRRMRYLSCAIELIEYSKNAPEINNELGSKKVVLYRFAGKTPENELFYVQIKGDLKNSHKYLMSVFPVR